MRGDKTIDASFNGVDFSSKITVGFSENVTILRRRQGHFITTKEVNFGRLSEGRPCIISLPVRDGNGDVIGEVGTVGSQVSPIKGINKAPCRYKGHYGKAY